MRINIFNREWIIASTFHILIFMPEYTDVNTADFILLFYVTDK
jgi:hypothetical protein